MGGPRSAWTCAAVVAASVVAPVAPSVCITPAAAFCPSLSHHGSTSNPDPGWDTQIESKSCFQIGGGARKQADAEGHLTDQTNGRPGPSSTRRLLRAA
jgi:hypothetical protein